MRLLITLLMLIALAASVSAIDASCSNGGSNYCTTEDTTCAYSEGDIDTDGDGWDDSCDAQPSNSEEWLDVDADGVGHRTDCDDFDPSIGDCVEPEIDEPSAAPTTITSTSSGGGSSGGSSRSGSSSGGGISFCTAKWECSDWGTCIDGQQTRSCERLNAGTCALDATRPELVRTCGDGDGQDVVTVEPLIVKSAPAAPDTSGIEAVTGNVALRAEESSSLAGMLLALAAALSIVLLLFAFLRK